MNDKNLDHLYQSRFSELGVRPGPAAWERILAGLDKRRKRKRRLMIWRVGGMAAVFLLMFGVIWELREIQPKTTNPSVTLTLQPEVFRNITKPEAPVLESPKAQSILAAVQTTADIQAKLAGIVAPTAMVTETGSASVGEGKSVIALGTDLPDEKPMPASLTASISNEDLQQELTQDEAREALLAASGTPERELMGNVPRRWSMGPRVAPVYYNSIGGGSPLDPRFNNNSKAGSVNMSYGFTLAYQVNPKVRIRSGVHKVSYDYDTRSVDLYASPSGSSLLKLQNIDYELSTQEVSIKGSQRSGGTAPTKDVAAFNPTRNGNLNQAFSYLEIPLEIEYAVIDKKIGIDLIGGFSSMILTGNEVNLVTGTNNSFMGPATNVNQLNLSSNLGIGLRYSLNPAIQLSLEPVFKYHWNTFSSGAEGFSPYTMGVYSGLNIRF